MLTNLIANSEGKRLLGRCRRGWNDNIKMYLMAIVCGLGGED
jgi:hypothetical protein